MVAAGVGVPDSRVDELLVKVGLAATARVRLGGLSLGMAQRLGIAQALLGNPPVLILDEPANGLDPHSIRWLRDLLRELAAEGRAVLVSSHLLTEMEHMADHIVVMARGRVLTAASIANVRERIGSRVNGQTPRTEELMSLARAKGAAVESASPGHVSITGLDRFAVGDLAAAHGIALHWLDEQAQSLEVGERLAGITLGMVPGLGGIADWLPFGAARAAMLVAEPTGQDAGFVRSLVGTDLTPGTGLLVFCVFAAVLACAGAYVYGRRDAP